MREQPRQFLRVRADDDGHRVTGHRDRVADDMMQRRPAAEFDELLGLTKARGCARRENDDVQAVRGIVHFSSCRTCRRRNLRRFGTAAGSIRTAMRCRC